MILRVLLYDGSRQDASWDYRNTGAKGFYSVLESLRSKFDLKEVWLVQRGGSNSKTYDASVNAYNIFSYKDGKEVIDYLKPDLILLKNDYEYIARSLLRAGKACNVPVVILISSIFYTLDKAQMNLKRLVRARVRGIMAHGRSIVKRYLFLLRTLWRSGYSIQFISRTIKMDFYLPFSSFVIAFIGGADLYLVNNYSWKQHVIKQGVESDKIVVVGECSLDPVYNLFARQDTKSSESMNILFITTSMVEDGLWTREQQDSIVTNVVKEISKMNVMLRIKIHPGESLKYYQQIVEKINPSIEIMQLADLLTLISKSDIIIAFASSTALLDAVLMRKRVFILNAIESSFGRKTALGSERVAIECNGLEDMINKITDPRQKIDDSYINSFIDRQVYKFDGECGKRAADAITNLLNKWNRYL